MGSFNSAITTSLINNGFPTAPTSGYLALTANSANKATNAGWWAVQILTNLTTPNGLGQSDLSKISLTAKVRAKGLPAGGAVAILKISASGDNPGQPTSGYKRVTFEPVLLSANDWVTIGGTFDDTGLQGAQGSRYNFTTTATSYEILVELSGYNQSTLPGYVSYNSPTGPSNGGRKNPGLAPNAGIRVEFDDVLLTVANPAAQTTAIGAVSPKSAGVGSSVTITGVAFGSSPTVSFNGTQAASVSVNGDGTSITAVVPAGAATGKITVVGANATATSPNSFFVTSPANLLADPNFDVSQAQEFWTSFEGARIITTNNVAPDANTGWNNIPGAQANSPFMFFAGWEGMPYAGFMQNQIDFSPTNGSFFTLTFRGKFEPKYSAGQTFVAFMNGNDTQTFKSVDINDQVAANLGQWATYTARYNASAENLAAMNGKMSVKIQPLQRQVGAEQASALIDDLVLNQQPASAVGPQISVKVGGKSLADGQTHALSAPLIGYNTSYPLTVANEGAEALTISSLTLPAGGFVLTGAGSAVTLQPGESKSYLISTLPSTATALSGTLTINSNDKDTADQVFVVSLQATPRLPSDDFNSSTPAELGWKPFYTTPGSFDTAASVTVTNGALKLNVNSLDGAGVYPWYFGVKKSIASPGTLDLTRSSLTASLRASGVYSGLSTNKVQIYLESLSSSGAATGRLSLGQGVDETTSGATPGTPSYFTGDGTNDRVAVLLPEGGGYTSVGGSLASAVNQGFKADAPAFNLVVMMTDFDFDLDAGNIVELDSLTLNLVTSGFELANGGFESDASNFSTGSPPAGWLQYPVAGVSKDRILNGDAVYNASTGLGDTDSPFSAYAGTRAVKIYGQNYYIDGAWVGPSQTGTVYQEWSVAGTAGLSVGQAIHARGAAKVYGIDPLTGGSTFKYGFRYMNGAGAQVGMDEVTTITASNDLPDQWVALVANGTIPADAAKVQLIAEFVQNAATDKGAVYLDDLSVGLGAVAPSVTVGSNTYQLVWSDEFDGTSLNPGNWVPETGAGGWGNNEAQTYTTNNANLRVENGSLILQAVKSGSSWTSARIKTQGLRSFKYGKIEFRAKLPSGIGPWPAAWMLGTNFSTAGWPACGEIDVMEWRGGFNGVANGDANTVGHALHSSSRYGGNPVQPGRSSVTNPSTEFHTYAVLWNSNNLVFSVDGADKATLTPPTADAATFQKEFFLILNLAMGGNYVGNTISSSLTSATYEVDYVRVYQDTSSSAPADTTAPVISISGANPASVTWGGTYTDAGASAFDAGDNASVAVTISNSVNTSVPGSYLVIYTAADSKSNRATNNRTVNVVMANSGTNRGADGLTDVLRYAFGGTGTSSISTSLLPSNTVSGSNLVLTYYARTNGNVSLTPLVSTDLANSNNWTETGVTVTTLSTVGTNGTTLEKRQASTPVSGTKKFLRLKATYTP